MQYYLAFIVFSILYLSISAQSPNNPTVTAVVQNDTTFASTTIPSNMNMTTNVSQKAIASSYVEPPPHPLGYCIRSRLSCSKIRRCCKGPCDVANRKKCP